ncbi:hypothetical protein ACFQT0_23895 [Hymenobacter humi]|uniref:Transposase n=1 Tax=Hymenobacter humi TaxID=1411620 RepID=A0ABW2U970_9BACT
MRLQVVLSSRGYVLFDDTVLDKDHSRRIELVRFQYSDNALGVFGRHRPSHQCCVNPETYQFWLINYHLFVPKAGSQMKLDHAAEMLA